VCSVFFVAKYSSGMKRTIQGMELEVWLSGIFSPVRTSEL
jgi:hypothetical protein